MIRFPASVFTSYPSKSNLGFRDGIEEWRSLLIAIKKISPYFEPLSAQSYNSEDHISPLEDFEAYVRLWEDLRKAEDEESYIASVAKGSEESPIVSIDYLWGPERIGATDKLEISILSHLVDATYDLNLVRELYSAIVRWRRPLYIHGGPPRPMVRDRVFSTRYSSGWACWIPESITRRDLPMAYSVEELGGGSLIFSNPAPFGWMREEYGDQIRKMQEVDIALNDLLLLPKTDISEDWSKPHREAFR